VKVKGTAYTFARSGNRWLLQQEIIGPEGDPDPGTDVPTVPYDYGTAVAASGGRIAIGRQINEFSDNIPTFGYVYEYRGSWTPVAELTDDNTWGHPNIYLGGFRMSGNTVMASGGDGAYGTPTFIYELPEVGVLPGIGAE
jgi:hypothetical protein